MFTVQRTVLRFAGRLNCYDRTTFCSRVQKASCEPLRFNESFLTAKQSALHQPPNDHTRTPEALGTPLARRPGKIPHTAAVFGNTIRRKTQKPKCRDFPSNTRNDQVFRQSKRRRRLETIACLRCLLAEQRRYGCSQHSTTSGSGLEVQVINQRVIPISWLQPCFSGYGVFRFD